jgi:hypothetical protein
LKLLVRNSCKGSNKNSGTARLWYGNASANSHLDATINDPTLYYLRTAGLLATTTGLTRETIDVKVGSKCGPYREFGTWRYGF